MVAQKPLNAFDVRRMPELIKKNETGDLMPFADNDLLAEKNVDLKNNRTEFGNFVANARETI
jgi:hypothetical protein